jgi:hypothetical protein
LQGDILESGRIAQSKQIFDKYGSVFAPLRRDKPGQAESKLINCDNPSESKQVKPSQTTCVRWLQADGHATLEGGQAGTKVAVSVRFIGRLSTIFHRRAESCLAETGPLLRGRGVVGDVKRSRAKRIGQF